MKEREMFNKAKNWISAGMLVVFMGVLSGCYGQYALVHLLYKSNGTIENKWARSGVNALLIIFPVYAIAGLGDVIIFNTIEFWSGKNPITNSPSVAGKADIPQNGMRAETTKSGNHVVLAWHYNKSRKSLVALSVTKSSSKAPVVKLYRSHAVDSQVMGAGAHVTETTFNAGHMSSRVVTGLPGTI